jgi:hypothetical protein
LNTRRVFFCSTIWGDIEVFSLVVGVDNAIDDVVASDDVTEAVVSILVVVASDEAVGLDGAVVDGAVLLDAIVVTVVGFEVVAVVVVVVAVVVVVVGLVVGAGDVVVVVAGDAALPQELGLSSQAQGAGQLVKQFFSTNPALLSVCLNNVLQTKMIFSKNKTKLFLSNLPTLNT